MPKQERASSEKIMSLPFGLTGKQIPWGFPSDEEKLRKHLRDIMGLGRLYFEHEKGLRFLESVIRYIYYATEIEPEEVAETVVLFSNAGVKNLLSLT